MRNRPWLGLFMTLLPVAFLIAFIGIPMILALLYSLGDLGAANEAIRVTALHQIGAKHGLTWAIYRALFSNPGFLQDILATVWVTVVSTAVVLLIGWIIALYGRFSEGLAARILGTLYIVPMFIPIVIASFALVSFFNDGGFLYAVLQHLGVKNPDMPSYTQIGVVLALVWTGIPFSVLLLSSGLKGVSDAQIEAARDVGASWPSIVLRILVPQNLMSTLIVITFSVIAMLGSYTVPYLTGPNAPQMLGVAIYSYFVTYNEPQQSQAMAMVLFAMAIGVAYFYVRSNVRTTIDEEATRDDALS